MSKLDRREFLKQIGIISAFYMCPYLKALSYTTNEQKSSQNKLIVIFLRGAIDGLNVVVPYGDSRYYEIRPNIAIAKPNSSSQDCLIDLDSHFGLNPAMRALYPFWQNKTMSFVYSSGSPDPTRSHFDAQDYMESGTPGIKSTTTGWMNRLITTQPKSSSPVSTMNFGANIPRILDGPNQVVNTSLGGAASKPQVYDRPLINKYFSQLYDNSPHKELSQNYQDAMKAHKIVMDELQQDMMQSSGGAPNPTNNFGPQMARLLTGQANITNAFIAFGGFDTHVNQGNSNGQLYNHVKTLSDGIAQLIHGLGETYKNTTIIVMSEFGRTARENGNRGTDHGHGNVMWILGGNVNGGNVLGKFGGLSDSQLYQNRDLPVHTDFRDVIGKVLNDGMGISKNQLETIFPEYKYSGQKLDIFA